MTLHPSGNAAAETGWDKPAQRRFAALLADLPGGVSAQEAAGNGAESQEPGIAVMRHQPEQQKVGAAGDGQRDYGGIDNRNQEEPEGAQMRKPVRDQGVAHAGRSDRSRWGKGGHSELDARVGLQAARR